MTRLSINCRDRRDEPNRTHDCRGCDCRCHHTVAPADFRAQVDAARDIGDVCADAAECMARENGGEPCCGRRDG